MSPIGAAASTCSTGTKTASHMSRHHVQDLERGEAGTSVVRPENTTAASLNERGRARDPLTRDDGGWTTGAGRLLRLLVPGHGGQAWARVPGTGNRAGSVDGLRLTGLEQATPGIKA